jgi:hypothetical protein
VSFLRNVLRAYSWIYEAIISFIAVAIAAAAYFTGRERLYIEWLPWPPETQTAWLAGIGLLGLILVVMAVAGKFRLLLFAFAIYVAYLLIKGLFMNVSVPLGGVDGARNAVLATLGALLAVVGAWPTSPKRR